MFQMFIEAPTLKDVVHKVSFKNLYLRGWPRLFPKTDAHSVTDRGEAGVSRYNYLCRNRHSGEKFKLSMWSASGGELVTGIKLVFGHGGAGGK
jgi:hypothetical protein